MSEQNEEYIAAAPTPETREPSEEAVTKAMNKNRRDFKDPRDGRNRMRDALRAAYQIDFPAAPKAPSAEGWDGYDFIYDPNDWEITYAWDSVDLLTDDLPTTDGVHEFATLVHGPAVFAAFIPMTLDKDGEVDDGEWRWFPSREAGERALKDAALPAPPMKGE